MTTLDNIFKLQLQQNEHTEIRPYSIAMNRKQDKITKLSILLQLKQEIPEKHQYNFTGDFEELELVFKQIIRDRGKLKKYQNRKKHEVLLVLNDVDKLKYLTKEEINLLSGIILNYRSLYLNIFITYTNYKKVRPFFKSIFQFNEDK